MGPWGIILISLGAAIILVIGGGLIIYMASLVKSAYQLKLELNAEMDARTLRMEEELDKKTRWIKRELAEEIEKARNSLALETDRRLNEMAVQMEQRLTEVDEMHRRNHLEMIKLLENHRQGITTLDQKLRQLRRDQIRQKGEETGETLDPVPVDGAAAAEAPAEGESLPDQPASDASTPTG
ncbi:hypothetical protein [Telmatospirillum sp. J64-1]|uniref:hypothetical protein n=1 Tax=Telmatospirillum sp. J64-1 TaxID=2502183 RepID=UPI00115E5F78|nr:hypothetical protein [Telmatospirillum sp. J64-1]